MTHRIGIIGGDGIGPDVIAEGLKVMGRPESSWRPSTTTWAEPATGGTAPCFPTR